MISVYPLQGIGSLSTSTMVHWEGTRFILDCGPGTMTEIWRRGLRLRGLAAVLISHAHLDHLWGLVPLLWFLNQRDWSHQIRLVYPTAIDASIRQLVRVSGELDFIKFHPITPDSKSMKIKKLTIQAFGVNHPSPSCGFTISDSLKPQLDTAKLEAEGIPKSQWGNLAQDKSVQFKSKRVDPRDYLLPPRNRKIVYTGDTGPTPHLQKTVLNADLLIIDASWVYPQWAPPEEAPHLTLRQAFEIFHLGNVKRVLLTHLTTRVSLDDYHKVIEELQQEFKTRASVYLPTEEKIEFD